MATNSIKHNVVIDNEKDALNLLEALKGVKKKSNRKVGKMDIINGLYKVNSEDIDVIKSLSAYIFEMTLTTGAIITTLIESGLLTSEKCEKIRKEFLELDEYALMEQNMNHLLTQLESLK